MADQPSEAQAAAVALAVISDRTPDGIYRGTQGFSPRALAAAQTSLAAGFIRLDLTPDTLPVGPPGLTVCELPAGTVMLLDWWFLVQPFDGTSPTMHVATDLYPDLNSIELLSMNDWQNDGHVSTADYLTLGSRPKLWIDDDELRVHLDDSQGGDPGSTTGHVTVIVRTIGAPST